MRLIYGLIPPMAGRNRVKSVWSDHIIAAFGKKVRISSYDRTIARLYDSRKVEGLGFSRHTGATREELILCGQTV